ADNALAPVHILECLPRDAAVDGDVINALLALLFDFVEQAARGEILEAAALHDVVRHGAVDRHRAHHDATVADDALPDVVKILIARRTVHYAVAAAVDGDFQLGKLFVE